MNLTKEQKFLYSRIAILITTAGWVGFSIAGYNGFSFWYGGFALCFWIAFGLLNFQYKSSLWYALRRPMLFGLLYAVLVSGAFLTDQLGLRLFLWVYPAYHGLGFLWVYFVLYPFGGLAVLELLYFLSGQLGESLMFVSSPDTVWHRFFDVMESLLFLLMTGVIVLGAIGQDIEAILVLAVVVVWMVSALIKLKLHIRHSGHYLLTLFCVILFAVLLHELPNTIAREWVYLPTSALPAPWNQSILSIPFFVWVGYLWLTLTPLRFWIFLVLNPRVK